MNDPYEQLIERLKADNRSLKLLETESGVPEETIRDIKSGKVVSPRISTLRALAKCFPQVVKKSPVTYAGIYGKGAAQ